MYIYLPGGKNMDKQTLIQVLTQHFLDHPNISQQSVIDCVKKAYQAARTSGMQLYEPIPIKRKLSKGSSYNAEIQPEESKGIEDDSLNESY